MIQRLDEAKKKARKSAKSSAPKADLEVVLKKLAKGNFPKYNRTETLRDFGKAKSFEDAARSVVVTLIRLSGADPSNKSLIKKYEMAIIHEILKG